MSKLNLPVHLSLFYLLAVFVSLGVDFIGGRFLHPWLFNRRLEILQQQGSLDVNSEREQQLILAEFQETWERTLLLMGTGGVGAIGVTFWAARRVSRPLEELSQVTQAFEQGNFEVRAPHCEIPELACVSQSFNRMAASLEKSEQKRRILLSDLTHELRTPLTITRGYLEGLAEGRIPPSRETYEQLIQESRRLENLVNNLQELSQVEAGSLPLKLEALNIHSLVNSLVERLSEQVTESVRLSHDCSANLPLVLGDRHRLEQILLNLVGNAMQYTEQGSITITTEFERHWLWVSVKDSGIGIATEDLPHVFERFWRGDLARTRRSGGSGLGLAITKSLVELQGGQMKVSSQLGYGSLFQFSLPLA